MRLFVKRRDAQRERQLSLTPHRGEDGSSAGVGRSHGTPSGGDGEEAEGACGPSPGRSGAEVGEGPAERPAAGRPQPGSREQLSGGICTHHWAGGAGRADAGYALSSAEPLNH